MLVSLIASTLLLFACTLYAATIESPFFAGLLGGLAVRRWHGQFSDEKRIPIRIAAVTLAALCVVALKYPNLFSTQTTYTNGTVLYVQPGATTTSPCVARIEYTIKQHTYQITTKPSSTACNFTTNYQVSVSYDPANPQNGTPAWSVPPTTAPQNPLGDVSIPTDPSLP